MSDMKTARPRIPSPRTGAMIAAAVAAAAAGLLLWRSARRAITHNSRSLTSDVVFGGVFVLFTMRFAAPIHT